MVTGGVIYWTVSLAIITLPNHDWKEKECMKLFRGARRKAIQRS